jgi:hypothetical protein
MILTDEVDILVVQSYTLNRMFFYIYLEFALLCLSCFRLRSSSFIVICSIYGIY